jgi:RND superfamily putative drug exporter
VVGHPRPRAATPLVAAVLSGGCSWPSPSRRSACTRERRLERDPGQPAVKQTYDRITKAFPGVAAAAEVVVKSDDVTKPRSPARSATCGRAPASTKTAIDPTSVEVSPNHRAATVVIPIAGDGTNDASIGRAGEGP